MARNATAQKPEVETQTVEPQLGFLASLATLATPVTDLSTVAIKKDPVVGTRAKFAQQADEQVKLIRSAAESGKWFKKIPSGYLLTLRNGNSAMPLNGTAHFQVVDAAAACKFIDAAKAAAQAGELDAVFKETARAPRKPKVEAAK